MSRRRTWKQSGCYVWRTRKPHAFLGISMRWLLPVAVLIGLALWVTDQPWWLALIILFFGGRHFAYCGETSSRYHRDRQHRYGGGTYGHTAKMWADLDPKVYPLPCLLPWWAPGRKTQEWLYIKLLLPVYNVQHNRTNPRRISLRSQEVQRWGRDYTGLKANVLRALARGVLMLGLLALAGWVLLQNVGQ